MYKFRIIAGSLVLGFALLNSRCIAQERGLTFKDVVEKFAADEGVINGLSIAPHADASFSVALCDQNNRVSVSIGKGARWRKIVVDKVYPSRVSVKLLDLDGDQKVELLVASTSLEVFKIAGEKLNSAWASDETLNIDDIRPRIELADLNNDGKNELVVLNYKTNTKTDDEVTDSLYVYSIETMKESLRLKVIDSTTLRDEDEHSATAGLAIGDFVDDPKNEIVVGNDNGNLWLLRLEDNKLSVLATAKLPKGGAIGSGLSRANMDQDSQDELLVGSNAGNIFVCEFDRNYQANWIGNLEVGRLAYGVTAIDLNGDGVDEFISSSGHDGYSGMTKADCVFQVFEFKDGLLVEKWKQQTVDSPRPLIRDVDGDGMPELILFSDYGRGTQVDVIKL